MTNEEAIKELMEEWEIFIDGCGLRGIEEKEAKHNSEFKKIYEAHRMAIQALEQTEWIPVSERLPEKNMRCLVAVGRFNFTQIAMYSDLMGIIDHQIFYQGYLGHDSFKNITQHVKAWMPLSKPYKAESEDKE